MKDLKPIIKECFANMYVIAKADMRAHFKGDKKQGKQWDLARALVFLHKVSENPDLYFAPEYTWAEWQNSVRQHLDSHPDVLSGCKNSAERKDAIATIRGCLVDGPNDFVYNNVSVVFQDKGLRNFCDMVHDFYYKDHFKNRVYVNEAGIREYAKKLAKWTNVAQTKNCVARGLKKQVYGAYQRQYN